MKRLLLFYALLFSLPVIGQNSFVENSNVNMVAFRDVPAIAHADIDGDNDQDIFITGDSGDDNYIARFYINQGHGSFEEVTPINIEGVVVAAAAFSDVDGDGDQDLLVSGSNGSSYYENASLYINNGAGSFEKKENTPFSGASFGHIIFGDVDNDNDQDVFIAGRYRSGGFYANSSLYLNDGSGNFSEYDDSSSPFMPLAQGDAAMGDLDGDQDLDLIISGYKGEDSNGNDLGNDFSYYINDGSGNFTQVIEDPFLTDSQYSRIVNISDIDQDADLDVFMVVHDISTEVWSSHFYINDGSGGFTQTASPTSLIKNGECIFSDIDNDGDDDFVISAEETNGNQKAEMYINDGNGNYTYLSGSSFITVWFPALALVDIDGDTDEDLFISGTEILYDETGNYLGDQPNTVHYINKFNDEFLWSGEFSFEAASTSIDDVYWSAVDFADVDGDNDQDVLVTGNDGTQAISQLYKNSGDGTYILDNSNSFTAVDISAVQFADIDKDGDQDVMIAGSSTTTLYINDGAGSFSASSASFPGLTACDVEFADIDTDGDFDLLLSGSSGSGDISNTYINSNGSFTLKSNPIVEVAETSAAFADVDGDKDLDLLISGLLESNGSRTTNLYSNNGTGNFALVDPTPFVAVRAGAVAFEDIDGDGDQDVLVTGASRNGPEASLYKNDGNGNFSLVSGTPFVKVAFSSVAFADIDGDNDPDLTITGNALTPSSNTPDTRFYENDGTGNFTEIASTPFQAVHTGAVAFADIDNDVDKDLLITGYDGSNPFTELYINKALNGPTWNGSQWNTEPDATTDVTITGNYNISTDIEVNSISVTSGNEVNVGSGSTLTINGNLNNEGVFSISDGASLLTPDETTTFTGNVDVYKQAFDVQKYNFMGSPVTNAPVSALGSNIYTYDETKPYGDERWIAASGTMVPGIGYTSFETGTALFTGTPNNGPISIDITRTEAGDDGIEGWNMVSNPYPSAITYDAFMAENGSLVNNTIYLWDESGKPDFTYSNGDYLVYDGTTTTGGNGGTFDGNINSTQGFFVQKTDNGTGTINFTNAMRVAGSNDNLLRSGNKKRHTFVKIKIESATGSTNQLIKFFKGYEDKKDRYDAYHLKGNPSLAFYSKIENEDFIINALPEKFPVTIQLGMDNKDAGEYTISIEEEQELNGLYVLLEDVQTGDFTALNETSYKIYLNPAKDLRRFRLHVQHGRNYRVAEDSPELIEEDELLVYGAQGNLYINDTKEREKEVKVYSLSGNKVYETHYENGGRHSFALQLPLGIYIVKILTEDRIETKKILLHD